MNRLTLIFITFVMAGLSPAATAQLIRYSRLDTARVFTQIKDILLQPERVYRLDLSREKLKSIPSEVFLCKNLNELILDKNKLTSIPLEISNLKYLQRFSVSHNLLEDFQAEICKLVHLRVLDLSDNYIKEIPDDIQKLKVLEQLVLWGNVLRYFPTSLGLLEKLETLDLLHNEMNQMEQDRLKNLLPTTYIYFSTPCHCFFDDENDK